MAKRAFLLLLALNSAVLSKEQSVNFLYAHGLTDRHTEVLRFSAVNRKGKINPNALIKTGRVFTFNFPEATPYFWRINPMYASLAQHHDIETLRKAYEKTLKMIADDTGDIVLIGLSRGASTAINFMATYQPKHIKAAILESPFDHIETVIEHKLAQYGLSNIPGVTTIAQSLLGAVFMKYNASAPAPIEYAGALDHTIPILLVCSKQDTLVPYTSTLALYNTIKKSGHKDVYILILEHGRHAFTLSGSDGHIYAATTHAFYKKYNLPHDEHMAQKGEGFLKNCQP